MRDFDSRDIGAEPISAVSLLRKEHNMTFTIFIKLLWAITIGAIVGSYTYYIKRDGALSESNSWLLLLMYAILGVAYLAS
jgi:uncharacterized membrane protein YfcA